jgi:hypothetical protein
MSSVDGSILRPELGSLPARMMGLPVYRGYPTPWFVAWVDGLPEFRAMDGNKWARAVKDKLCWVCGGRLGTYLSFVVGPMCLVTGTSSEPPSHELCATWSAKNCPFLTRPKMIRREGDMPEEAQGPAGYGIDRNPGVCAVYTTRNYKVFGDHQGRPLIKMDRHYEEVEWWAEGRKATQEEVQRSVETGLPYLMEMAGQDGEEAVAELKKQIALFEKLLEKSFEK